MEVQRANLNMGMRCIKYMIFIINFMFVLTAILLITVGSTIQSIFGDFDHFLDGHFSSPPALLVAIGIILLIVSTFGCIGAIRESTLIMNLYGVLLSMIFILEIAAAISAFVMHSQVGEMLERTMSESLRYYQTREYARDAFDFMQSELECCGVRGADDWYGILDEADGFNNQKYINVTDVDLLIIPNSCCAAYIPANNMCTRWYRGCFRRLNSIISQSAMLIATGAITVAFVQFLGIVCAFMLAKTIRRTKSVREARRWQLQQGLGVVVDNTRKMPAETAYTQMEKSEYSEPATYLPNSPSVN